MSDSDVFFEPSADGGSYVSRTNELRFVSRLISSLDTMTGYRELRVLQQKFVIHRPYREEWRDVPLVDENATPKTAETQAKPTD